MAVEQILWGAASGMAALLLGLIVGWARGISSKMEAKVDKRHCDERYNGLKDDKDALFKHKHAPSTTQGKGGEVIIP